MAPVTGFIYVVDNSAGPMSGARPGATVRVDRRRPKALIVVDCALDFVYLGDWPGRLWKVEVADAMTNPDRRALGLPKLPWRPGRRRFAQAFAVNVLEELPLSRLFGPCGAEAICCVLDHASRLEADEVPRLVQARHPDAEGLWRRWYDDWMRRSARGWRGLLERLRHGRVRQNNGTGTLRQLMYKRAKRVAGGSAFVYDEEDDANVLNPAWQQAYCALRDVAIAFSSPSLYTPEERLILTAAWRAVIGPEPSRYHADPV